jgi:hypothetical protein
MRILTTATTNWLNNGCCDVKYLDLWRNAPLSYRQGQDNDSGWHIDHHKVFLLNDNNGRFFHKAADLLLRYQFYPDAILSHFGDFDLGDGRQMRVGDRIVQRIHLARLFGRPLLDIIGLTEVTQIFSEPRRRGFAYVTAAPHVEQGEWSVQVAWDNNGDLTLTLNATSRPAPQEPAISRPIMRAFQEKAHQAGITHFKELLLA